MLAYTFYAIVASSVISVLCEALSLLLGFLLTMSHAESYEVVVSEDDIKKNMTQGRMPIDAYSREKRLKY